MIGITTACFGLSPQPLRGKEAVKCSILSTNTVLLVVHASAKGHSKGAGEDALEEIEGATELLAERREGVEDETSIVDRLFSSI